MLLAELLAQGRTHDGTSDAGRGIVMSLARLSPGGVEGWFSSQYDDFCMFAKWNFWRQLTATERHTGVDLGHIGDWI